MVMLCAHAEMRWAYNCGTINEIVVPFEFDNGGLSNSCDFRNDNETGAYTAVRCLGIGRLSALPRRRLAGGAGRCPVRAGEGLVGDPGGGVGLQFAHDGGEEATSRWVADDAGVSERVLLGYNVKPKLCRKSNRTYRRLISSLPADVARCYGYVEDEQTRLERELSAASEAGNWSLVAELAARLGKKVG